MNKSDISALIRFNFWANGRVLTACTHLTPDQFTGAIKPDPGWGTLRGILVHILDTEYGWRSVLQAQEASTILNAADFADVAALIARWEIEKAAWLDYLAGLREEPVNQSDSEGANIETEVWQTIMHVVTHGIQHRSEVAFILTGYGHSPGELDFDLFLQEEAESIG